LYNKTVVLTHII